MEEKWMNDLSEQLFNSMMDLSKIPSQQKMSNLNMGENLAMIFIHSFDGITPKQLSDRSRVSTARVAKILGSLEAKGYIKRKESKDDKRSSHIYMTQLGEEYFNKQIDEIRRIHYVLFENLGREDSEQFMRILSRIIDINKKINLSGDCRL